MRRLPCSLDSPTWRRHRGRHARLSSDLAERLRAGDQREASVIVTGTDAQVDALAARHGLRIKKRLATGAVVDVPAGALAALADDPAADQLRATTWCRPRWP